MRGPLIAALMLATVASSGAAVAQVSPQDAFTVYRDGVLGKAGAEPGSVVTSASAAVYDRARRAALEAAPEALDTLPLGEAVLALRLRGSIPAADLRAVDGAGVVTLAARHGLIGGGFDGIGLKAAEVYGDHAMAEQVGPSGRSAGVWWRFLREGGVWRVDLRPNFEAAEAILRDRLRASGQTRADFLNTLAKTGR